VRHRWDGNVRELRHEAVRVGSQVGAGGEVGVADLSPAVAAAAPPAELREAARGSRGGGLLDEELARLEISLIDDALAASGRNLSAAARRLGISRTRLYRRLGELGRARD
jgi:two-component system NtrC family response regulator